MIIGLTGKSCAGKDTVAAMLPAEHFSVIDVDGLGHRALEANHDALREAFGASIFRQDGSVDRKILGPLVFSDHAKLETLNGITHPWMREEAMRLARKAESEGLVAVINAALLESMGFVPECDEIVLVVAPYEVREARAMSRDGITEEGFCARAEAQKDIGLSLFSSGRKVVTIINDDGEDTISRQVIFLCANILKEEAFYGKED